MSRSRCPSSTELLAAIALAAGSLGAACSDDAPCGPGDAPPGGITVAAGAAAFAFGGWRAGANNDCPAPGTPAGVVSLTVYGRQVAPAGQAFVTLCLPRPDLIEHGTTFDLDPDVQPVPAGARAILIDVQAAHPDGCRWRLGDAAPSGTARFEGLCGRGADPAGFALTLSGAAEVVETCDGQPDRTLTVTLSGTAAVAPE